MASAIETLLQDSRSGVTPPPVASEATPPKSNRAIDQLLQTSKPEPPELPKPQGPVENLLAPFARLPGIYTETANKNWDDLSSNWKELWQKETVAGKAWSALKLLGSAGSELATPFEAGIRSFAGEPFEATTGIKGSGKYIGELGSFATQMAAGVPKIPGGKILSTLDPLGVGARSFSAIRQSKIGQGIEKSLSPTTRSPEAGHSELLIRQRSAQLAQATAQARESLEHFRGIVAKTPEQDRINFMLAMGGEIPHNVLPVGLQPLAQELRNQIDKRTKNLQKLGLLEQAHEDYWPRLWSAPKQTSLEAYQSAVAGGQSHRPIRGAKTSAGLARRTLPTMQAGLDMGLKPITTNPIDMAIIRMRGMDKWYYGSLLAKDMKSQPYVKFFRWFDEGKAKALGWAAINDPVFKATLPPAKASHTFKAEAEHFTAYDPEIRRGLEQVANHLGIKLTTPLTDAIIKGGTYGYTGRSINRAVARFGGDEAVLMHEVGHQIDFKYGLGARFAQDPQAWKELETLARLRAPGATDRKYVSYLLEPTERIANLFHAYWHAPGLLRQYAPRANQLLNNFLRQNPDLKKAADQVKPSVQLHGETRPEIFEQQWEKYYPGLRQLGGWYAPESVSRVFNNYASENKWFGNGGFYDAVRGSGNILNMVQLGLSAFHYAMVSIDTGVQTAMRLPGLLKEGRLLEAGKVAPTLIPLLGPMYAGARAMRQGRKFKEAYLNPGGATPEMQKLVDNFLKGGGRIDMDTFYHMAGLGGFGKAGYSHVKSAMDEAKTAGVRGFFNGIKNGYLWETMKDTFKQSGGKNPVTKTILGSAQTVARAFETTMEPLMSVYVPSVKRGVFMDAAKDWIKSNPAATEFELRQAMTKIVDSIDNRLGQMIYDNVFWTKTQKELAFLMIRAVGWNMGTIRELGGGLVDAAKSADRVLRLAEPAELSMRAKYSMALPMYVALQGAMLTYLYTGRGPNGLLDYFYPPNGRLRAGGAIERVSIPSYVKDVFSYNEAPGQTLMNKLHPLWEMGTEYFWTNRDYYGGIIRDPEKGDPGIQTLEWLARSATPFSIRGVEAQAKEGADLFPIIMNEFGFVPAPMSIVDPKRQERFKKSQDARARRRLYKELHK